VDIQLTAVDAGSGRRQDVVLVVEPDSMVADAERVLRAALGVEGAPRPAQVPAPANRYGGPPAGRAWTGAAGTGAAGPDAAAAGGAGGAGRFHRRMTGRPCS
jgi:hypothetical protein